MTKDLAEEASRQPDKPSNGARVRADRATAAVIQFDLPDRGINHGARLVHDLLNVGWSPTQVPSGAKLAPNRQLIELRTSDRSIRLRVSIYKVGDRGEEHRLAERRIEITKTFASGLPRLVGWADVVLGYDFENDVYVGLDSRRLALGGKTHNASSSVDPAALVAASGLRLVVRPHETQSLGLEYQAFFRPERLGEYLFNYVAVHAGRYLGDGLLSGRMRPRTWPKRWTLPRSSCLGSSLILNYRGSMVGARPTISKRLVEAYEIGEIRDRVDISPEKLEKILRKCQEVGDAGESFVYQSERKRLHKAGRDDLASRIDWVSRTSVSRGYDIKSFETDGAPRFIEVKATIGDSPTFFVSSNEFKVANKQQNSYWIYRIVRTLDAPRISAVIRNPFAAENAADILRVADGWRVTILRQQIVSSS